MPENQTPAARRDRRLGHIGGLLLLIVFLPVIFLWLLVLVLTTIALHLAVLIFWVPRGRSVLFVYSESPVWRERIEEKILPHLPPSSTVLNWSQRQKWRSFDLGVRIFRHYAGDREMNPVGIIIRPFRRVKIFRFWKPFRDFKHGRRQALEDLEAQWLQQVNSL